MFQIQILQIASEGVFFSNQKKVIIKLQGIKDTSIDSDGNRRRTFLYAVHSERRTGGTLSNLRNRASLICSPIKAIFCSSFRGNLVPIVFFAIVYVLRRIAAKPMTLPCPTYLIIPQR